MISNPVVFVNLIDRHEEIISRQLATHNANILQIMNEMQTALNNMENAIEAIKNFNRMIQNARTVQSKDDNSDESTNNNASNQNQNHNNH